MKLLSKEQWMKQMCKVLGHRFDEFHLYDVVCSRCRICRDYTQEDIENLEKKKRKLRENNQ